MLYAAAGLIMGLCMAMWIYLPAMNYTPYSIRSGGSGGGTGLDYATAWSFSFGEMATFFIPSFYGFGGAAYWGNMPFTDYPNYMGILVLTFAVVGILFYEGRIKWYFVTTGIIALFLSFGKNFFLYQIFYEYFLYFNKFRVPVMLLILTQFSMVILAGLGLETASLWVLDTKNKDGLKKLFGVLVGVAIIILGLKLSMGGNPEFGQKSHPVLNDLRLDLISKDTLTTLCFLIAGAAALYAARLGRISKQGLAGVIICLSVLDMSMVNRQIIDPGPETYRQTTMTKKSLISLYLSSDEVIRYLQKDTTLFRILPLGRLANENRWSAFRIASIMGYHPAKIFRYNKLKDEVGWNSLGVLQMLNVKYIVSFDELSHPAFDLVFTGKLFHSGKYENAKVYQFKYALPRVFFTDHVKVIPGMGDQFDGLRNPAYNPVNSVFVGEPNEDFEYSSNAEAVVSFWSPDRIEIDGECAIPSVSGSQ